MPSKSTHLLPKLDYPNSMRYKIFGLKYDQTKNYNNNLVVFADVHFNLDWQVVFNM